MTGWTVAIAEGARTVPGQVGTTVTVTTEAAAATLEGQTVTVLAGNVM